MLATSLLQHKLARQCALPVPSELGWEKKVTVIASAPGSSWQQGSACAPPAVLSYVTHGSHILGLSSSPQGEIHVQQAPCFCRVVWGGLVTLDLVWFAFAAVFFLLLSKLQCLQMLHAQLNEKGKVKESFLVFGADNRELFRS